MTVNNPSFETQGDIRPASALGVPTNELVKDDSQLADLIFRSKTFVFDWIAMFDELNMSMELKAPSGSCPDMGRRSSAYCAVPKKATNPTNPPIIEGGSKNSGFDLDIVCR